MNIRRILLSLAVLFFAGSVVAGGTGAFFSDEERSEGNMFTAGAIDLTVDSVAHYNGMICFDDVEDDYRWLPDDIVEWVEDNGNSHYELMGGVNVQDEIDAFNADPENVALIPQAGDECTGTWDLRDLGGEELPATTFFNFADLKPGDSGENTISLHVENNDAWACVIVDNMVDEEVGDLTEPEAELDNTPNEGELSQEINFFAWADDGDNVYEGDEMPLFDNDFGPAIDVINGRSYPLFTPDNGAGAMTAEETQYIGLYWCYGAIDVIGTTISCDGGPVTNLTQADKLTADIGFYVEQARNNPDFECPGPREPELPEAIVEEGTTWTSVDTDDEGGDNGLTGNDFKRYEWFAKAKVQEAPNPASDFELQVGVGDTSGTYFNSDDTEWTSAQEEMFTLTYDGAGTATYAVAGRPTVSYSVPISTYGRIGIYVKANTDATTELYDLSLDLAGLSTTAISAANADNSLLISGVDLSSGFVLTGKMKFTWDTLTNNGENQKVQFSID